MEEWKVYLDRGTTNRKDCDQNQYQLLFLIIKYQQTCMEGRFGKYSSMEDCSPNDYLLDTLKVLVVERKLK